MPNEDGNRGGNVTQEALDELKKKTEELAQQLKTVEENRKKAEELAEKFRKDNDAAQQIIQRQGSEIDVLKKGASTEPKEPTLEELESSMTDEDWSLADKFLETIQDESVKRSIVNNDKERVKVLKMIKGDATLQPAPTSFRRESKKPENHGGSVKELFESFKKSLTSLPAGPGSTSRSSPGGPGKMIGNNTWPSDKSRKQDSRVK